MKSTILFITLLIISLSILSQELVEVGSWEYGPTEAVAVKDSTAYISSGKYLWVLDISDESSPVLVDELYLEEYINFIRVLGNYMYVSRNDSLLHIYSIHNQHNPVLEGTESMGKDSGGELIPLDITFNQDTVFIPRLNQTGVIYFLNDSVDIQTIKYFQSSRRLERHSNIGISYSSSAINSFDMTESVSVLRPKDYVSYKDYVRGLTVNSNTDFAYTGIGDGGIGIVQIVSVDSLIKKDSVHTGGITYDVELIEDTILIAGKGMKGIGIYDVDNDTIPTEIGSCDTDGFVYELEVIGERVYAGARSGGLVIIDISDKTNPTVLGSYEGHSEFRGFDIKGDRLYAAGADGGLCIYDITAGNSLNFISKTYTRYISEDVSVDDSFAYVAEGDSGLTILDITNESNPSIVGYLDIPYFARQSGVYQNTCVVGGNLTWAISGIITVDVSNPSTPLAMDTLLRGKYYTAFQVYDNKIHCIAENVIRYYQIWEIISPDSLILKDSIKMTGTDYFALAVDSNISFLSINSTDTVLCFDISNSDSMVNISTIKTERFGYRMSYNQNLLYELVYDSWSMYVYDYTDPYNPTEVCVYPFGNWSEEMKHSGEYLYMSVGGGLKGNNLDRGRYGMKILRLSPAGIEDNKTPDNNTNITTTFNTIQIENKSNNTQTYQITDITGRIIKNIEARKGITKYTPQKSGIYFIVNKQHGVLGKAIIVR